MISSRPGYRVLTLPELLRGPRNIKGLRNTNMNLLFPVGHNPLMNDAHLSQTADRAKTRQPGILVKASQIVLSSYNSFIRKIAS